MVKRITKEDGTRAATMRDIAELVGVSQATVSYVLNAKKSARVSLLTRQRIIEAARRLEYRPNAIARAMSMGRSRTIGVYQPHIAHWPLAGQWTMSVLQGIREGLHAHHHHLLLFGYRQTDDPGPRAFMDGRVDGLIILAPHLGDELPRRLAALGFPVAIVGAPGVPGLRSVAVDSDNVEGGRVAVRELAARGCRRIAHISGPANVPNARDRLLGYRQALAELGMPYREELVRGGTFREDLGRTAALELLALKPRPDALFAANDLVALGALQACAEAGVRVPEDVAVLGYDDSPVCDLVRPRLSSIAQPAARMGREAAEMLLSLLEEDLAGGAQRLFPPTFVERESTGVRAVASG